MHWLVEAAERTAGDPAAERAFVLEAAPRIGVLQRPDASTFLISLAAVASVDLTLARRLEPHLDALGILRQAGISPPEGAFGVFAAEAPGVRLEADRQHVLHGRKPWCSLAGELEHALVTAHEPSGGRRLYLVALQQPGVRVQPPEGWVAKGLPRVPSTPVDFDAVPSIPVGEPGWYLERPGFALGGIGVAACWWGGAVGLVRRLHQAADRTPEAEMLQLALGEAYRELLCAELALAAAARRIDAGEAGDHRLLAQRVRSTVRAAADRIRSLVVEALGPAPLAFDAEYAARVADLELYVAQDHGRRDLARLGRLLLEQEQLPW